MGILRDTYIVNVTDTSSTNRVLREQNKILKENSEKEIKARDRVDITLEEYNNMKDTIKQQGQTIEIYQNLYNRFAEKIKIDLETLIETEIEYTKYEDSEKSFGKRLLIVFEIPNYLLEKR